MRTPAGLTFCSHAGCEAALEALLAPLSAIAMT
jgi:hypothetical protein